MTEARSVVYWGWDGVAGMDYKGYKEIWGAKFARAVKTKYHRWGGPNNNLTGSDQNCADHDGLW